MTLSKTMPIMVRANECAEPLDARRHRGCRGEQGRSGPMLAGTWLLAGGYQGGRSRPSASHEERTADLEPKTPSRRSRTRRSTHAINAMNAMNAWLMACSTVSGSEGETCRSPRLARPPRGACRRHSRYLATLPARQPQKHGVERI